MKIDFLLYLFIFSLSFGCNSQISEESNESNSCDELSPSSRTFVKLSEDDEPGENLILFGKVIDYGTGLPIIDANLYFYQADSGGLYNSTFLGMPSFAKIRGKIRTNTNGCFIVKTIVPGNYPDQADGKHIHVIAKAKGYKKWTFEFLFEGSISESLRKEVKENNDAIILNLKEKESKSWLVHAEIKLQQK